ncbi:MAG TPA: type II CAAX endopeptidase family protein [Jiangellaceae bacterium]|nr:type II CAAX endopeptidase family protein [Jiangellaceae bacterium]
MAFPTSSRRQQPVLLFFVLAFAWSWAWWGTAAVTGARVTEPPGLLLYLLGVLGPLVGAVWMVHRRGRMYRQEFLRRVVDPRGISARWWLALLAVAAGPAALGAVGASVAGRAGTAPGFSVGAAAVLMGPALVAGLVEEPGWRGAVSDAWQVRTRPVWAATGIGVLWSLWHLPLSIIESSYYHELGAGSLRFWLTHLMLVQLGVLLVWLANGSGGSILVAVLAHAAFNVAVGLAPGGLAFDVVALLALTAATSAVVSVTRGRLCFAGDATAQPSSSNVTGRPQRRHRCNFRSSSQRP